MRRLYIYIYIYIIIIVRRHNRGSFWVISFPSFIYLFVRLFSVAFFIYFCSKKRRPIFVEQNYSFFFSPKLGWNWWKKFLTKELFVKKFSLVHKRLAFYTTAMILYSEIKIYVIFPFESKSMFCKKSFTFGFSTLQEQTRNTLQTFIRDYILQKPNHRIIHCHMGGFAKGTVLLHMYTR